MINSDYRRSARFLLEKRQTMNAANNITASITKLITSVWVKLSVEASFVSTSAAFRAVSYTYYYSAYSSKTATQFLFNLENSTPLIPANVSSAAILINLLSSVKLNSIYSASADGVPNISLMMVTSPVASLVKGTSKRMASTPTSLWKTTTLIT